MAGDGRVVILAQLVPVRRHRYAVVPAAPKTYAVAGVAMTRSTSRRVHGLLGAPRRATGAKAAPPFLDTNSPSAKVARNSAAAPAVGATPMPQHRPAPPRAPLPPPPGAG